MTVRYLEIFTEVCRHMSMSKAARALMISQSSVSQAVKALEQEYDVLLFERLNHTLYLTPAGEKLLYLATQVLKSIDKKKHRQAERRYAGRAADFEYRLVQYGRRKPVIPADCRV